MASRSSKPLSPEERRRRLGRRIGTAIFGLLVSGATVIWSVEILVAVFSGARPSPQGCAGGTATLKQAIERARSAYEAKSGSEDERQALSRYRNALRPEWDQQKAVEAACEGDARGEKHLKDVIALRYAEEHAVRYESLGLAPLRRRVNEASAPSSDSNR